MNSPKRIPPVLTSVELSKPNPTLRVQTLSTLRSAILNGHLVAGQKLIERELCELTGASRSVLREALAHLEATGLIERQSYKGFTVTRLSSRMIDEIFELRALLETQAAELFTERASEQEIEALKAALVTLEDCIEPFDLQAALAAKEHYYNIVFTGCRNVEICRAIAIVIDRVHYMRGQLMSDSGRRQQSIIEMRRLTAALVNRDRLATRDASLAHNAGAKAAVHKLLTEYEPSDANKTAAVGTR